MVLGEARRLLRIWCGRKAVHSSCRKLMANYPDFLCKLNDGTVLALEYKESQGWTDAEDDRDIGNLWAQLSNGSCKFAMVRTSNGKSWKRCCDGCQAKK